MAMNTIQNRNRLFIKFCKIVSTNQINFTETACSTIKAANPLIDIISVNLIVYLISYNSANNDLSIMIISPGKKPCKKTVLFLARAVTDSGYQVPAFCTNNPFANRI
jgi:hypothetical protein